MRVLKIGTQKSTQIVCLDEPGASGACHKYEIRPTQPEGTTMGEGDEFAKISFHESHVKEFETNGCYQEDLLAIVIDRLQHFQNGNFSCRENAIAITKIEEAIHWLNHRPLKCKARGTEDTSKK